MEDEIYKLKGLRYISTNPNVCTFLGYQFIQTKKLSCSWGKGTVPEYLVILKDSC